MPKNSYQMDIVPNNQVQSALQAEGLQTKKRSCSHLVTKVSHSPDQTKTIKHRRDQNFMKSYTLSNQAISSLLCPSLSIKDTFFPRMYLHTNTTNAIDGTWDSKRTILSADANVNSWLQLPLFPALPLVNQSTRGDLQTLTRATNRLTSAITCNVQAYSAADFAQSLDVPSTTVPPTKSAYTSYYQGGAYNLEFNNTSSNPAIITCWVLTPRRPMKDITDLTNNPGLMPLSLATLDKYEQALTAANPAGLVSGAWPNPTLSDAYTTTKIISDDVDKPTDWDFSISPNDRNLQYHYSVSKSKTFTLNSGDTLDYQVDFQPFKFNSSEWLNSFQHAFMPFCSKILLVRVRGKAMPSRSTATSAGTVATTLGGPTMVTLVCKESHNAMRVPTFINNHQKIINNDLNDNNKDWQFYDIDPNDETIKVVDLLNGVDAS